MKEKARYFSEEKTEKAMIIYFKQVVAIDLYIRLL